jgi:hypothetical protein
MTKFEMTLVLLIIVYVMIRQMRKDNDEYEE